MKIKPYGDTLNDGKVQLSFTLPLKKSVQSDQAALVVAKEMGLIDSAIVFSTELASGFSYYIIYGSFKKLIDLSKIEVKPSLSKALDREEIEKLIKSEFDRDLVFVGASTGTDAHTVGIDAIMNMKGFAGHFGLERYQGIKAYNLGSQVLNEELIRIAREKKADVILVSQTVTQKEVHLRNMVELVELLESENLRDQVILIAGGARITHELAKELGYDAGFGPGSFAEDVASFAVKALIDRKVG